jgi:hypothetical protein
MTSIHRYVRQAVRFLVPRPQGVPDREPAELRGEESRLSVKGLQVGVFDLIGSEHLVDQQQRVGNHLQFGHLLRHRHLQRIEQSGVLRYVVGSDAEEAGDLDDLAVLQAESGSVAGGAGISPRGPVDVGNGLQEVTVSR